MNIRKKPGKLVISASTPEKLMSVFIKLGGLLKNGGIDKSFLLEDLNDNLTEAAAACRTYARPLKISGLSRPDVYLYDGMAAYHVFLSYNLSLCPDGSELGHHIEYIADFLGKCMCRPGGGLLAPSEVEGLLNIVQYKFGFLSSVTYSRDLDIYLINRSHMYYDSFLLTYKTHGPGSGHSGIPIRRDKWMLFCLSPCLDIMVCNKYYVFLHEIGHILYNALTDGSGVIPELFGEITFLLELPKMGADEKPDELFADIFAAVSLYKTCYWDYNPFKDILSGSLLDFLETYFRMLSINMSRENKNPYPVQSYIQ